jgi:hypothetical protein
MRSARRTEEKQTVQGKNKVGKDSSSLTRPFKIPRLKETAKTSIKVAKETFAKIYQEKDKDIANDDRSDSEEEDSVPISQLLGADKEKVRGHRKDNSEWGKRMEKELGRIEKRQQKTAETSSPNVINGEVMTRSDEERIPIMEDSLPISQTLTKTTEILTNEDEVKENNETVAAPVGDKAIGEKIARDFGELGVFRGYVYKVETERGRHYYNVKYEDEDMEEWDESQYIYGRELRQSFDTGQCNVIREGREEHGDCSSGDESIYSADREERELQNKKRRRSKPTPKKLETIDAEAVTRLGGKKTMMSETFQKLTPISQDKVCADMQKPVAQAMRKTMQQVKNNITYMCLSLFSKNNLFVFSLQ